jgi:hypothetical protein
MGEVKWEPGFLDIQAIHEYRRYPNYSGIVLPGSFQYMLDQHHVRVNGLSDEFPDDPDPWTQKAE